MIGFATGTAADAAKPKSCSAKVHAQRVASATAYAKRMSADRRKYFKTHGGAKQRKAFVAAQKQKLMTLRAAARCVVHVTTTPDVVGTTITNTKPVAPAPVGPTPSPPTPTPPPPPAYSKTGPSTLTISADVNAPTAASIRDAVTLAETFIKGIGASADWRYDLYADSNVNALIALWPTLGTGTGLATSQSIWTGGATAVTDHDQVMYLTNPAITTAFPQPPGVPIHELFHTAQNSVLGAYQVNGPQTTEIQPGGPVWLREGSAEYFQLVALQDAGFRVPADDLALMKGYATTLYAANQLEDMSTQQASFTYPFAAYALGYIATDMLIHDTSRSAILEFYRQIGQGSTWQAAFQNVFGRTVEQFYAEFAAARAAF